MKLFGILSSIFCFLAGLVMLGLFIHGIKWFTEGIGADDLLYLAFAFYFIGKGFYTGPMIIKN